MLLLNNSSSLTADETAQLGSLIDEFPYSQAIHNMVARGEQLNSLPEKQKRLNLAAVYSTDRAALKAFITAPSEVRKPMATPIEPPAEEVKKPEIASVEEVKEVKVNPTAPPVQSIEKIEKAQPIATPEPPSTTKNAFQPSPLSGDELLDELFHDLDTLKKLKHNFEVAVEAFDKLPSVKKEEKEEAPTAKKEAAPVVKATSSAPEGIIAEIKSTKKKIKPSDPKQKEQLEIIDNFIKSKPSIGKKSANAKIDNTDLSENSSVFSDNIVSETLVEILIKQGKKEKAIEVLKKLIWKFPQKKAYFAAQIEELKS